MTFKDILKNLRNDLALTQKDVAEGCGLSPQCISQLEMGIRNPTGSTLLVLADFFEVSTDYLLGLENEFGSKKFSFPQKQQTAQILNQDGKELIEIFNQLEHGYQVQILEYARYIAERRGIKPQKNKFEGA